MWPITVGHPGICRAFRRYLAAERCLAARRHLERATSACVLPFGDERYVVFVRACLLDVRSSPPIQANAWFRGAVGPFGLLDGGCADRLNEFKKGLTPA